MEENNKQAVIEIAEKLIDLRIATDELIQSDEEIIENCNTLINECDNILNS